MADSIADMIARQGGEIIEAPALREVPIGDNPEAIAFAETLLAGGFDAVVFMTGVGARYLAQEIETKYPREVWFEALRKTKLAARGPKPLAVLREWGFKVDVVAPEPNTFEELLAAIDAKWPLSGLRIAVQEYGKANLEFQDALTARGATVTRVPAYRWALPEDVGPLKKAIDAMIAGEVDALLITSAQQVVHLLEVAARDGREDALRDALRRKVVVASIGPTTSATLREYALPIDLEPDHPKMGRLVAALAARGPELSRRKKAGLIASAAPKAIVPDSDELADSIFLRACRREPTEVTPIWLMRQAGRYMAEYRAVRSKVGFLELCKTPELATEVAVVAAERLGVDAAILFADILLALEPIGFDLEFSKGEGPIIHNPVREAKDVDRVGVLSDPAPLNYVFEAVRLIRAALPKTLPLIGFAGAPFTLACYAIEGGASRHYERAKVFMHKDVGAWNALMDRLVDTTVVYLAAQAEAGAQALQLFDSWVGTLAPEDYRRFVQPHMRRLFQALPKGVPTIHFGTDTNSLLELQRDAGGDVIGLDWRVELGKTWDRLGDQVAVQGNLDPALLLAPFSEIEPAAKSILDQANRRPGHIFNLGHGILPQTPVDHVLALVDYVHQYRSNR